VVDFVAYGGAMKLVRLSGRLEALAGFIDAGAFVVDVGTDHGFLPVYLAQTGAARHIIASDISAASLDRARCLAVKHNVADAITFCHTPGLAGVTPGLGGVTPGLAGVTPGLDGVAPCKQCNEDDRREKDWIASCARNDGGFGQEDKPLRCPDCGAYTVVISGLGGETILGILRDAPWTRCRGVKLILQPQSKVNMLFRFLYDAGYIILGTKYVLDRGKRYIIILSGAKGLSWGGGAGF
jgi:tRNA A22 N-methylase